MLSERKRTPQVIVEALATLDWASQHAPSATFLELRKKLLDLVSAAAGRRCDQRMQRVARLRQAPFAADVPPLDHCLAEACSALQALHAEPKVSVNIPLSMIGFTHSAIHVRSDDGRSLGDTADALFGRELSPLEKPLLLSVVNYKGKFYSLNSRLAIN